MEVEAEGSKEVKEAMANGQIFCLPKSENLQIKLKKEYMEEMEVK